MTYDNHNGACPFCSSDVSLSDSLCPDCGARYGVFARDYETLWKHDNQKQVREVISIETARTLLHETILSPLYIVIFMAVLIGVASFFDSKWVVIGAAILGLTAVLALFEYFLKAIAAVYLRLTLKPRWISSDELSGTGSYE
jgi:hypothetical protein